MTQPTKDPGYIELQLLSGTNSTIEMLEWIRKEKRFMCTKEGWTDYRNNTHRTSKQMYELWQKSTTPSTGY